MYMYRCQCTGVCVDTVFYTVIPHFLQAIQDIILKGHQQAFVWMDEWHGEFTVCTCQFTTSSVVYIYTYVHCTYMYTPVRVQ